MSYSGIQYTPVDCNATVVTPIRVSHSAIAFCKTAAGAYEAVNYHRFADDIVIAISGHHSKRGWAERALQRIREQFALIGVELNQEKTKVVDALKGEAFGFPGFALGRVRKRNGEGYFVLMTPKKKARKAVKAKIRDIIGRGDARAGEANQRPARWVGQRFQGG